MRRRIGTALVAAALVAAVAVATLALPAQAKPIVEPMRPRWLVQAHEWDRTHPAYRQRSAPPSHAERRKPIKPDPMAEHVPLPPHWSTSQAYA